MASNDSEQILQLLTQQPFRKTGYQKHSKDQAAQFTFSETYYKETNISANMSEWEINQERGFENIETESWEMMEDSVFPNAWGYFAGGRKHDLGQDMLRQFALRMLFARGEGVFVRAEKFFDVPERYRKLRKAPESKPHVQLGMTIFNVVGEGMFPFRMWSVSAESYITLNLKVLVVEDLDPVPAKKCNLDMWVGMNGYLPFRRLRPPHANPAIFQVEYNVNDLGGEEEWVDVGAWTHSKQSQPELRPSIDPTLADGIRHQKLVRDWFQSGNFQRMLQLSAAGAGPGLSSGAEVEPMYNEEELDRAVREWVSDLDFGIMLREDARRQLEGGDFI